MRRTRTTGGCGRRAARGARLGVLLVPWLLAATGHGAGEAPEPAPALRASPVGPPGPPAPPGPALVIRCSPTSVTLPGRPPQAAAHPIAAALTAATPGAWIRLDPGEYPPFSIGLGSNAPTNARTSGGAPGRPIVVDGGGMARITAWEGDTIAIDQKVPNGHITFRNLEIETSKRAGVMFYQQSGGRVHEGFTFEDCHLLGGFDHVNDRGRRSKWGLWAHSLKDFRFAGTRTPARVEGIRSEHGFYIQNPRGDVTIENVRAELLGRTFCQFTARANEGPPGQGTILVRRCDVRDVAIARDDAFKGGSAFTVAGRLRGRIVFEGNRYRAGFDPFVRSLTRPGQPYGTGAFVAWDGGQPARNATLVLKDNDFRLAPGCGDRALVSIGGCDRVEIVGANHFESGGTFEALALDPVDGRGKAVSRPNGQVLLAPTTELVGTVTIGGAEADEEALRRLRAGAAR